MKSSLLVSSTAVILCAASAATARPAVVAFAPTTIHRQVQQQQQKQALFLSSFPVDTIVPEPERYSITNNKRQEVTTLEQLEPLSPMETTTETPSLNPVVAVSIATVMMVVAFATTTVVAPTPVVVVNHREPVVVSETERRVRQDAIDYELQEEMMAADVASGGFFY